MKKTFQTFPYSPLVALAKWGSLSPFPSRSGQTLIEVIIAVGLIVMVLTTLAAGLTLGIKNNRYAKDQALAKDYVRESQEWLRNMRDQAGWETFASIVRTDASGNKVRYCLTALPSTLDNFNSLSRSSNCSGQTIDGRFVRQMDLDLTIGAGGIPVQIDADVTVSWVDGTKTFTSNSTLTLYQRN